MQIGQFDNSYFDELLLQTRNSELLGSVQATMVDGVWGRFTKCIVGGMF